MKWAEEMKKCNELMSEMAACQKVYEEKARTAEKKLEDFKKGRKPKKGEKQDENGNKVQNGTSSGENGVEDSEDEFSEEEEVAPMVTREKRADGKEVLVDPSGQLWVTNIFLKLHVDFTLKFKF